MATITTSNNPVAIVTPYTNPDGAAAGGVGPGAMAKIRFADVFAVAALGAGDESQVVITCTLPPGYYYRILQFNWRALGTATASFNAANGYQAGANVSVVENQVSNFGFPVWNQGPEHTVGAAGNTPFAVKTSPDSVTNDFTAFFDVDQAVSRILLDASQSGSTVTTWMDTSADATTAVTISFVMEFLQFTIDQARFRFTNSPTLVY